MQRSDEELLTKAELAETLKVSLRTVERWMSAGEGPTSIMLPGGRRRWRVGDVRAWLEDRKRTLDD